MLVEVQKKQPLIKINHFTKNGCIDYALSKIGKTRDQILKEIQEDKKTELQVLNLFEKGKTVNQICLSLEMKLSDVKWIIKSDECNLSYRGLAKKYGST